MTWTLLGPCSVPRLALGLLPVGLVLLTVSCAHEQVAPRMVEASKAAVAELAPRSCAEMAAERPMVPIDAGTYRPQYGSGPTDVRIGPLAMDAYPVTQVEFLEFVKRNPNWRRSQVKALFADNNYLRGWDNDTTLGSGTDPQSAVTHVSWFAANAYCACEGKRLPTVDEWEFVAMADSSRRDARKNEAFTRTILDWYGKGGREQRKVGTTSRNLHGVYDMHGSIWEWTADFSSVLMGDDSREGTSGNFEKFCGSASLGASDAEDYAAFMRFAFRASLKAQYSVHNLGFRCVRNEEQVPLP